ncbi:UreD-domain-containing protein [Abortiporus biennis]|nr:UreD-domain-containing protein [Abortiporus biennis]
MSDEAPSPSKLAPGVGHIGVARHGHQAILSELSYAYPLKLLSTIVHQEGTAVVYMLTYGGGLVGGDNIELSATVQPEATLVLLTQGSTKVFKNRHGQRRLANSRLNSSNDMTKQSLVVEVSSHGALFLLPDPVTCFRAAKYSQRQVLKLDSTASVVLLDWITSGRKSLGEYWSFSRYSSLNEIWINGKRVARDMLLLEERNETVSGTHLETLGGSLAPYSCYATVLLYGPILEHTLHTLAARYNTITVFKKASRPKIIWSFSSLCDERGGILRVAGEEAEDVRHWLGETFKSLEDVIGIDTYRRTFG